MRADDRQAFRSSRIRPGLCAAVATAIAMTCLAYSGASQSLAAVRASKHAPGRRMLSVDDILHFKRLTEVQIAPDGRSLVYVLVAPGHASVDGESSTMWLLDIATKTARPLLDSTAAEAATTPVSPQPRWSPAGSQVAYLSPSSGHLEVWSVDIATGHRRQLTRPDTAVQGDSGSVREFAFSPKGDAIAYVRAFSSDARDQDLSHEKVIALSDHPYLFSREGVDGSYAGSVVIELLSLQSGHRERLTPSLIGASAIRWSPDGTRLVFISFSDAWRDARVAAVDPMLLTVASKKLRPLVKTWSMDYLPAWSPDGKRVAYLSHSPGKPSLFFLAPLMRSLYTIAVDDHGGGRNTPRTISGHDISIWFLRPIIWAKTNVIYAASRSHATARVYAYAPDGQSRRLVTPSQFYVRDFSLSADGRRMAAIFEDANRPPEVYVGDPQTGAFTQLTNLGAAIADIAFGKVEMVKWRSRDDRFDVEGFLIKPPDFMPGKRYPLLVNMHGGPRWIFENGFADINFISGWHSPAQIYAAHGYLVLLPNKRGDESYGADFVNANVKTWGQDVEDDVFGGIDMLVAKGLADPNRLGIMGASYGGSATAWAIAHSHRFKAASIDEGPMNWLSYYSQAYLFNDTWADPFLGGNPSTALDEYVKKSPIIYANRIETPTLMRYGENRFPRPYGMPMQGMELFRALHERGVPADFIYTPTQGHVIEDAGIYRDWIERNLRWFDYWILGKGANPVERILPQRSDKTGARGEVRGTI